MGMEDAVWMVVRVFRTLPPEQGEASGGQRPVQELHARGFSNPRLSKEEHRRPFLVRHRTRNVGDLVGPRALPNVGSDDRQSVRTDGLTPTVMYYLGSTAVVRVPFGEERLGSEGRGAVCRARDAPVAVSPFPNDGVRRSVR